MKNLEYFSLMNNNFFSFMDKHPFEDDGRLRSYISYEAICLMDDLRIKRDCGGLFDFIGDTNRPKLLGDKGVSEEDIIPLPVRDTNAASLKIAKRLAKLGYFIKGDTLCMLKKGGYEEVPVSTQADRYIFLRNAVYFAIKTPLKSLGTHGGLDRYQEPDGHLGYRQESGGRTYYVPSEPTFKGAVDVLFLYVKKLLPLISDVKTAPYPVYDVKGKCMNFVTKPGQSANEYPDVYGCFENGVYPEVSSFEEAASLFGEHVLPIVPKHIKTGRHIYLASLFWSVLKDAWPVNKSPCLYFYSDERGAGKTTASDILNFVGNGAYGLSSGKVTGRGGDQWRREFFSALDKKRSSVMELANVDSALISETLMEYITAGSVYGKHTGDRVAKDFSSNAIPVVTAAGTSQEHEDWDRRTAIVEFEKKGLESLPNIEEDIPNYDYAKIRGVLFGIARFALKGMNGLNCKYQGAFPFWATMGAACLKAVGIDADFKEGEISYFRELKKAASEDKSSECQILGKALREVYKGDAFTIRHLLDETLHDLSPEALDALNDLKDGPHLNKITLGRAFSKYYKDMGLKKNIVCNKAHYFFEEEYPEDPEDPPVPPSWGASNKEVNINKTGSYEVNVEQHHTQDILQACLNNGARQSTVQGMYHCGGEAHKRRDLNPSLSIDIDKNVAHCFHPSCTFVTDSLKSNDVGTFKYRRTRHCYPTKAPPTDVIPYLKENEFFHNDRKVLEHIKNSVGGSPPYARDNFLYSEKLNCIAAKVITSDRSLSVHRLFLNPDMTLKNRAMLGDTKGGYVEIKSGATLNPSDRKKTIITEGIETALALSLAFYGNRQELKNNVVKWFDCEHPRIIAGLSATNIPHIEIPPHSFICIAGENDSASNDAYQKLCKANPLAQIKFVLPSHFKKKPTGFDFRDWVTECR